MFPDNPIRLWCSLKKDGRFQLEAPVDEAPTSDATSGHSNYDDWIQNESFQQLTNTNSSCSDIGGPIPSQGNPIGIAPEDPILVTRKDGRLGKLKINLVVQDEIDTDAEGSDEIYGEELEITTHIQRKRIQSTSLSPVAASTTIHEVIRFPQPPQPPIRSPTRPSTLASTSTNI
ncbi:hypothetical protein O181_014691 [Austropuccinia psidii MF-1]|uniref:Uncharacterized protein n=1 Tax=Austropuccinia psidii MF-1 TaxID=1389203 RepID=A0A9Q3BYK6_9BASI|nr:hypothetical protein [Austropuccinia psidii MF-1]